MIRHRVAAYYLQHLYSGSSHIGFRIMNTSEYVQGQIICQCKLNLCQPNWVVVEQLSNEIDSGIPDIPFCIKKLELQCLC